MKDQNDKSKLKKIIKDFVFAVGRRKESVARVRLYSESGEHLINNQTLEKYFPGKTSSILFSRPFRAIGVEGKYRISAKVKGGGKVSQLSAILLGIARALSESDKSLRPALKREGLLTRDPRARERRKVGTGGRARRKKQSPKR